MHVSQLIKTIYKPWLEVLESHHRLLTDVETGWANVLTVPTVVDLLMGEVPIESPSEDYVAEAAANLAELIKLNQTNGTILALNERQVPKSLPPELQGEVLVLYDGVQQIQMEFAKYFTQLGTVLTN